MIIKMNGVQTLFRNFLKFIFVPLVRFQKLVRKFTMRQVKFGVASIILSLGIGILLRYSWHHLSIKDLTPQHPSHPENLKYDREMIHVPLNEIYSDNNIADDDELFDVNKKFKEKWISTIGCKIPIITVNYTKHVNKKQKKIISCGKRAIFLTKIDGTKVQATIENRTLKRYFKGPIFDCCYQFVYHTSVVDRQNTTYSACSKFKHKSIITLQSDFININCYEYTHNSSHVFYSDMYAFAKKLNVSKPDDKSCSNKYNVLMLGMDSMSLSRFIQTMPRVAEYFKNNFWISYQGYHKVADNTFPNLMAAFTGKNITTIAKTCSERMDHCNKYMIWDEFNKDGYITAYGEDFLSLPDTFAREYNYHKPPTDHYMRPFFFKESRKKHVVCTGKLTSGQQILNYALDFANTYKRHSFFGFFWMNSLSHQPNSRPQDADKMIENFFNQLIYTSVTSNTFIIFFSDHGVRFGNDRLKAEAYYDDRMPMFFMSVPPYFKRKHPLEYEALAKNQYRLVTPYDMHATLMDIKKVSKCENSTSLAPDACPNCHSLFRGISDNRTCQDVRISDKWCSCHVLYPLPLQDSEGLKTVKLVGNNISTTVKSIKTRKCWGCRNLAVSKVHRIHYYYDRDKINIYYVIAITIQPGNATYEATTIRKGSVHSIVGSISLISGYRGFGQCVTHHGDRLFCICQRKKNCK